jgi:hypothetical protein
MTTRPSTYDKKMDGVLLYYFINTFHWFTLHYCFRPHLGCWKTFAQGNNSFHWFTLHYRYTYLHTHQEKLGSLFQKDLIWDAGETFAQGNQLFLSGGQ